MSGRLVVKRYVKALYETAKAEDKLNVIKADMIVLDKILNEAPSIRQYCLKTHSGIKIELDFVKTAFVPYINELTARLLITAVENGRIAAIPFMTVAYNLLLEEKGLRAEVLIESAQELSPEIVEKIKTKMAERTGTKITYKTKIIPGILGGFRIIWQNKIIDLSALGRLKKVRQLLKSNN